MSERQPAKEQHIGRLLWRLLDRTRHGLPIPCFIEFFRFGKFLGGRITGLRQNARRKEQKQKKENQSRLRGTASKVQCSADFHSDSNPSRESRSIFRCAGSFT